MSDPLSERGHYYLVGFMGAGKTTVGMDLARFLGRDFVDLDREIEDTSGLAIREIFAGGGEAEFRRLEEASLREVSSRPPAVVATGGGTIVSSVNREIMARTGVSIWLNDSLEAIIGRIDQQGQSDRPMIGEEKGVRDLFRARLPAYRTAELRIDVGPNEGPAEVAARIFQSLRKDSCDT